MSASTRKGWKRWLVADLAQLVRGRVRPYRNWRELLAEAELSAEARDCVRDVVRRTRLWRLEMADVAQELLSHFADGREAGRSDAQLLASFGDPVRAARLIRRAKRSQRPVLYRFFIAILKSVGVVAAIYGVLVGWTNSFRPNITVDYRAKLEALAPAAPDSGAAWPYYRKALAAMEVDNEYQHPDRDLLHARPGATDWLAASAWCDQNAAAIDWIREGGRREALGFHAGRWDELSDEDWRVLFPEQDDPSPPVQSEKDIWDTALYGELHLFASKAKLMATVLALDIRVRASRGEDALIAQDFAAGVALAEGLMERPRYIHGLVAQSILYVIEDAIVDVLNAQDQAMDSVALSTLRRQASAAGSLTRSLEAVMGVERWVVHDLIQRTYSSGFLGVGLLTREGVLNMSKHGVVGPWDGLEDHWVATSAFSSVLTSLTLPVVQGLTPGRDALEARFDAAASELICWAGLPLGGTVDRAEAFRRGWEGKDSLRDRIFTDQVDLWLRFAQKEAWFRARHHAFEVRLALEALKTKKGQYPYDLDALIPDYLPSHPSDPITGEALLYQRNDGRPWLYSRGWDRDDDGGRHAVGAGHLGEPFTSNPPDGDWVFFPAKEEPLSGL